MKKTKTLCFANNKGGSGKSTTCCNVGYELSKKGYRVLLIDGDMQMNLSLCFFSEDKVLEAAQNGNNLYTAIKEQKALDDYIMPTDYEGLDLIVSSSLMSGIEYELFTKWQREFILKKCLQSVKDSGKYDFILIDAPPTLGGWVMNLLCASDYLMIPVEASPWGLFGLANMLEFFSTVCEISPDLSLLGVAVTKVDERKNYFRQTMEALSSTDGVYLFDSYIRVDSSIEWAQDNSKPVAAHKPSARSAKEYRNLTEEVLSLVNRKK
ncbi:MAG: ParA family protein [Clostridia bacterium]|nr:ParA family protein [Clostridia bacterium]